jgi:VWFA-related protein
MQARQAADERLASMEPSARVGIFTTSGRTTLDFTDDRDQLRQTLLRIQLSPAAAGGLPDCPDIGYYQPDLMINKNDDQATQAAVAEFNTCTPFPPPAVVALAIVNAKAATALTFGDRDTRMALDTLRTLVRRMAILPGSRTIVLVSPGFFVMNEHRPDETDLMDRAIRANVTISSLDARGLYVVGAGTDISLRLPSSQNSANLLRNMRWQALWATPM